MATSTVDPALETLRLRRAIRNGTEVRQKYLRDLAVAAEELEAIEIAHANADRVLQAAGAALQQARERMSARGQWAAIDYQHIGDALHPNGDCPPEYATEYRQWLGARERMQPMHSALLAAQVARRDLEDKIAAADDQLAEWRAELAQLEAHAS